jgi:tetratricopeptide (TPR) repeat protein
VPAALAAEEPYRFEDPFWNVVFAPQGLRKLIAPTELHVIFKGRAAGDVYVEIRVHEGIDPLLLRKSIAEKAQGAQQGDEPRPWLFHVTTKHKVFEEVHGHAFYARGPHVFEVHGWVTDRTPAADKDIRAALDALAPGDDPGCGTKAREIAALLGKEPLDPKVLLEAGRLYLSEKHPTLAAGLLRRARAVAKPDALKKEEEAALLLLGGLAMLEAGAPKDALPWLRDAEKAAGHERACEAAYHLARAAAAAGEPDEAFEALDRAFAKGLVVPKARLSKEKELDNVREDPRWEAFWRRRVQDQ